MLPGAPAPLQSWRLTELVAKSARSLPKGRNWSQARNQEQEGRGRVWHSVPDTGRLSQALAWLPCQVEHLCLEQQLSKRALQASAPPNERKDLKEQNYHPPLSNREENLC